MMVWSDYGLVALIVAGMWMLLTLGSSWVSKYVRFDLTDKEKFLQKQVHDLKYQLEEAQKEIANLQTQNQIITGQYEATAHRLGELQIKATRQEEQIRSLQEQLRKVPVMPEPGWEQLSNSRMLLVAIGSEDVDLQMDVAALRAVRQETGMVFTRLIDGDPDNLKIALDRARSQNSSVYLHLAVRSSPEGFQYGKYVLDLDWLSANLSGVVVLLVAGSNSANVGDSLGVVPYVITMSDDVNSRDVSIFSRAFWTEIGKGIGPTLAIERAAKRSPSSVSEVITRHWS
jgi:hypothetical protein